MLAGVERRHHGLRVEVGLRADEHRVDVVVRQHVPPVGERDRNLELLGGALGAGQAAVADRNQLDARNLDEAREQLAAGEAPGADDADANGLCHGYPQLY